MDLEHLKCFVAVAEERHFGRAAQRLHRSTSPVSRSIQALEKEFGTPLFVRLHHGVELTGAGQALLAPARDVLERVARLPLVTRGARGARPGSMRLAVPDVVQLVLLDRVLSGLRSAAFDDVVLDVVPVESSVDATELVERGDADLALAHLALDRPGLSSWPVYDYRWSIAMRDDDELAGRPALTVDDLCGRTVGISPATVPGQARDTFGRVFVQSGAMLRDLPGTDLVAASRQVWLGECVLPVASPDDSGPALIFRAAPLTLVPIRDERLRLDLALVWRPDQVGLEESQLTLLAKHVQDEPGR